MRAFHNEAQVVLSDETVLRFVLSFREIDLIETMTDLPMPEVLPMVIGPGAKYGTVGKVVWALLREHQPDLTLDQAAGLMFGDDAAVVGTTIGDLFRRSFNIGVEKAKDENPRKRRGASKTS
jgi:hypothetical protein